MIAQQYGNRVRVRVCGICVQDDSILLIRHKNIGENGVFWSLPGGGVEFGETLQSALEREFLEETRLHISVQNLTAINEFIAPPLHALEFFFKVDFMSGNLTKGIDPELDSQIIEEVRWLRFDEIKALPQKEIHPIFQKYKSINDISTQEILFTPSL